MTDSDKDTRDYKTDMNHNTNRIYHTTESHNRVDLIGNDPFYIGEILMYLWYLKFSRISYSMWKFA